MLIEILLQYTRTYIKFSDYWQAGIPDGVLNVVPGFGKVAGVAVSSHMDIDKVV